MEKDLTIVKRVKTEAGGTVRLANLLVARGHRITPQAISQWTRIPAERARDVAEITGIPIYEIRGDLWWRGA